ncbi:MAG TPA: 5-formyltetrahydrofolate cyclo-ligase [Deltaproteobacteria bacterium]|nr:5-formyltetrahydrofolate cyclo-ligase [Deltaproteobacteria bacterium]
MLGEELLISSHSFHFKFRLELSHYGETLNSTTIARLKEILRREAVRRRAALTAAERAQADAAIAGRFMALPQVTLLQELGVYWSTPEEASTREIVSRMREAGARILWPRWIPEASSLEFAAAHETELLAKRWGILEPSAEAPVIPLHRIDGLVIPGLAFDESGRRLGRGRGFYDRVLQNYRGLRFALAYDIQVLPEVPAEAHDERVDWILTETRTIACKK